MTRIAACALPQPTGASTTRVPWPDRLALSPTLGMAHATDEGKEPGVHYSEALGRDTRASATRSTLAVQKAAPAAAAKKAGATELDPVVWHGRDVRVRYHGRGPW